MYLVWDQANAQRWKLLLLLQFTKQTRLIQLFCHQSIRRSNRRVESTIRMFLLVCNYTRKGHMILVPESSPVPKAGSSRQFFILFKTEAHDANKAHTTNGFLLFHGSRCETVATKRCIWEMKNLGCAGKYFRSSYATTRPPPVFLVHPFFLLVAPLYCPFRRYCCNQDGNFLFLFY